MEFTISIWNYITWFGVNNTSRLWIKIILYFRFIKAEQNEYFINYFNNSLYHFFLNVHRLFTRKWFFIICNGLWYFLSIIKLRIININVNVIKKIRSIKINMMNITYSISFYFSWFWHIAKEKYINHEQIEDKKKKQNTIWLKTILHECIAFVDIQVECD